MNIKENFNKIEYIFTDFDGTISTKDVINSFITTFSKGDYLTPEKLWCEGKISTEECLKEQFDLIQITKSEFADFLYQIEIDPYFVYFRELIKSQNKKIIVLSDGFEIFIRAAFEKYGIKDVEIFSNQLYFKDTGKNLIFEEEYPNGCKKCEIQSGCCKCEKAKSFSDNFIYIGDGMSDRCIAKKANLLFAKKGLAEFCKKEGMPFVEFETFEDIIRISGL